MSAITADVFNMSPLWLIFSWHFGDTNRDQYHKNICALLIDTGMFWLINFGIVQVFKPSVEGAILGFLSIFPDHRQI